MKRHASMIYQRWPFDPAEAARRQKETAACTGMPLQKSIDLGDGVTIELLLIPAGEFEMGSPPGEKDRWGELEGPVHRVRITRPFYLGKHEVTQEVWEKVMGVNPSTFPGRRNPVETVSWQDCQGLLKKLNARQTGAGTFRLPTEAQWEHACRAGAATRFYHGDDPDLRDLADHAWFVANSAETTHPVGMKRPNAWGLYDMLGNVWEWCLDWYGEDYFARSPVEDPPGPPGGTLRVLRGSSLRYDVRRCRIAYRVGYGPTDSYYNSGVRLAVSLDQAGT